MALQIFGWAMAHLAPLGNPALNESPLDHLWLIMLLWMVPPDHLWRRKWCPIATDGPP